MHVPKILGNLQYAVDDGTISLDNALEVIINMTKKGKILSKHKQKISFNGGRFQTYVYDESKPGNRRKIVKPTEQELYDALWNEYFVKGKISTIR